MNRKTIAALGWLVLLVPPGCEVHAKDAKIVPSNTRPGEVRQFADNVVALARGSEVTAAALEPIIPGQLMTSPSELPCDRPNLLGAPRQLADATWMTSTLWNGAHVLTIEHEPISGVTGKMVQWAWSNLGKMVKAPGNEKEQQVYMLQHPIDHGSFTPDSTSGPSGSWRATKFLGTGCSPTRGGGKWSVTCDSPTQEQIGSPANGFTCTSPATSLRNVPDFDTPYLRFSSLTPTYISVDGMWDGNRAGTLSHTLTERQGKLYCTTTWVFGTDGLLGMAINTVALQKTVARNMAGKMEKTLPYYAVHEIQEFGFYPLWLPDVYNTYALP